MLPSVTFKDGTEDTLLGLAIPYGGPFLAKGKPSDLHGERFTEKTELCLDWYDSRPLLYGHGRGDLGTDVVGRVTSWEKKADGVWAEMVLERSSEYFETLRDLISKGKLYLSSGAMAHLVETDKTGDIRTWPWVELSLTEQPANLLARIDESTAERHFKEAGLDAEAAKAAWSAAYQNDLPDSAFAVILPGGKKDDEGKTTPRSLRKLPHHDADGKLDLPHLRNALARLPQTDGLSDAQKSRAMSHLNKHAKAAGVGDGKTLTTGSGDASHFSATVHWEEHDAEHIKALPDGPVPVMDEHGCAAPGSYEALSAHINRKLNGQMVDGLGSYCYVIATFPDYVTVLAYEGGEAHYYQVEYVLADDGMPVLGEMREVEQVYIPKEMEPMDSGPLAMASARFVDFATSLRQRTQDLAERRSKEQRPLSAESREHIAKAVGAADSAISDVRALLADTADGTQGPSVELARHRLRLLKSRLRTRELLPA